MKTQILRSLATRSSRLFRIRSQTRITVLALLAATALPLVARAVPVSVVGGFTSFTGTVGSDGQFTTFINGNVVCPDAGCNTGLGTATLALNTTSIAFSNSSFGVPATANFLSFAAAAPQEIAQVGDEFLLGTFTYTNGIWFTGPTIGFRVVTHALDPAFNNHIFADSLLLTITANSLSNTAAQNSDYFSFVQRSDLGNFNAYELGDAASNTVSVDLYARIGSLIPTRFANPTGGGFVGNGVTPVILPGTTPVPEPASLSLLGLGLAGLGLGRIRRRAGR